MTIEQIKCKHKGVTEKRPETLYKQKTKLTKSHKISREQHSIREYFGTKSTGVVNRKLAHGDKNNKREKMK